MTADATQYIEIDGVVIPTQWDKRGNIIQVAIQSDNFERYLVDGEYAHELIRNIDHNIRISGIIVGEDLVGDKIIRIHEIKEWSSTK